MQFPTLLFLAFGAGALAAPLELDAYGNEITDASFNSTETFNGTLEERALLEKRGTFGWVGVYADNDPGCKLKWDTTPGRPEIKDGCVTLNMDDGRYLGINWGTGNHGYGRLAVFSNGKCADKPFAIVKAHNQGLKGPRTCWDNGLTKVNSVMNADDGPW